MPVAYASVRHVQEIIFKRLYGCLTSICFMKTFVIFPNTLVFVGALSSKY